MSATTETLRLVIDGDSKGAVRATREWIEEVRRGTSITGGFSAGLEAGSKRSLTFRDRLSELRTGVGHLARGELPQASQALGVAVSGLGKFAVGAGVAVGAIVGLVAGAEKLISKYLEVGKQVGAVSRILDTTAGESDALRVQLKMLGLDTDSASGSWAKFTVALGQAQRTGSGPAADAFARLGVSLKDQNGNLKDSATVLSETRDKLSKLRQENLAAYRETSKDIFGKGYMTLDKWLGASVEKITKFNKIAESLGTKWDTKSISKYLEDSREISLRWEDLQTTLGGILVQLKGPIVHVMETLSHKLTDISKTLDKMPGRVSVLQGVFDTLVNPVDAVRDALDIAFKIVNKIIQGLARIATMPVLGQLLNLLPGYLNPNNAATPTTNVPAGTPQQATASAQSLSWLFQGVPGLASEGLVKATRGGTIVRVAEGGEDEVVLKASRFREGRSHETQAPSLSFDFRGARFDGTSEQKIMRLLDTVLVPKILDSLVVPD